MSAELVLTARNKTGNYFRQGFNCAESVFLGMREVLKLDIDAGLVRMMTGFGGGLGQAGCVCGALTGSASIIGLLSGRTAADGDRDVPYEIVRGYSERFEKEFGATCCRVIQPYEFDTPEALRHCLKVTGNAARLLMQYLVEKGLV